MIKNTNSLKDNNLKQNNLFFLQIHNKCMLYKKLSILI